jgi:hypothetical protein
LSWRTLGSVPPGQLAEARVQLHHAAQLASAVGATFLEPRPDDGHPNLGWDDALGALVGHPAQVAGGVQGGLRVAELELLWLGAAGTPKDSLRLVGRTLDEARAWLARALASAGADVPQAGLRRTGYAIPDHAVAHGAAFSATGPAHEELARWFANGHHALVELAAHVEGAADVRLWPHHFDIGGLAALRTNPDGSLAQSIGFGLSPRRELHRALLLRLALALPRGVVAPPSRFRRVLARRGLHLGRSHGDGVAGR